MFLFGCAPEYHGQMLMAFMVITLCHYSGYLDHGQVLALLDCLREVGQHVLADVEAGEKRQAGDGGGDAAQLIVSQVQLLQAVTVEQGPGGENYKNKLNQTVCLGSRYNCIALVKFPLSMKVC